MLESVNLNAFQVCKAIQSTGMCDVNKSLFQSFKSTGRHIANEKRFKYFKRKEVKELVDEKLQIHLF